MKALFNGTCSECGTFKPRCATVAVRGTTAWGDRETRVMTLCESCRRVLRGLCTLHPKHRVRSGKE